MIKTVYASDVGRVRSVNEDSASVVYLEEGYTLGIVADGMGGHQAGDRASQLTVETILQDISALPSGMSLQDCDHALKQSILHANDIVYQQAQQHVEYYNMGTTVVAVLFNGRVGTIGHIGDSRAYLYRAGEIVQLTDDHSLVNELLKNKQITLEEASVHPRRNVLTRALGTDEKVNVDMDSITLENGDILLLCSDGLSNYVTQEQMTLKLGSDSLTLDERADGLIQLALDAGGDDNITVALLELDESAGSSTKEWNS